ncbi:MAG: hypothetical protein R3A79_08530 [Nannocystaceae bacterium]
MIRVDRIRLTPAEQRDLRAAAAPFAAVADLAALLRHGSVDAEVWAAAAAVARQLPPRLVDALGRLGRHDADALWIEEEPVRVDLPGSWEGVQRRFAGGLTSDWLALAYAFVLGARRSADLGVDQVGLEWQLGSDGLHRDTLTADDAARGPWRPRYAPCTFSSLKALRTGSNPRIRTCLAHRRELFDGRLREHLATLRSPIFRCRALQRDNPLPPGMEAFAVAVPHPDGGDDVGSACAESSLFMHPRLRAAAIDCPERARPAIDAFCRARTELEAFACGFELHRGARVIIHQGDVLHGRLGGIRPKTDDDWARERWLSRCNWRPTDAAAQAPAPSTAPAAEVVRRLAEAHPAAKRAWLRDAQGRAATDHVAAVLSLWEW